MKAFNFLVTLGAVYFAVAGFVLGVLIGLAF